MSERIDHAAESARILSECEDVSGGMPWELLDETEHKVLTAALADAQVHATLALVERQDTANRIAYLQIVIASINAGTALEIDQDGITKLAAAAYEGLDLS
jgi:hypothetical protein